MAECARCNGTGVEPGNTYYTPACDDCGGLRSVVNHVACGWAFDAGVLEAQRDRARAFYERMFTRDIAQRMEIAAGTAAVAAVAAERGRCLDACYRESRFAHPSVDAVRDFIESGAPAPREW
jgi:hypothetical protein